MRVLLVSDVYFPRVNGVSTSIRTFRADLDACGVQTLLAAPDYGRGEIDSGDGVMRVPSVAIPGDPEDRRMRWRPLLRTLDTAALGGIDLVHIHTPFVAHYAGVRLARRMQIPCVATYHTFFEEYLHHYVPALPRRLGRPLARAFTRSQCADVRALIAPSEPMRAALLDYGVTTAIHIIPTGLPPDRFKPGDGRRFRAWLGIAADRPLMMYVGRVAHEKNIEFLVHAFVAVRSRVPKAMLVVAGEGPARASLERLIASLGLESDTRFVGYLERDGALLDCYAAADVFAFASRTETQGLVLLEAMAQGAAIVSTAELGTRSILQPGSGAVVVAERLDEFAAAVIRLLGDAGLRHSLAAQGRAYARTWASTAMARRLRDLYAGLCTPRSGALPAADSGPMASSV